MTFEEERGAIRKLQSTNQTSSPFLLTWSWVSTSSCQQAFPGSSPSDILRLVELTLQALRHRLWTAMIQLSYSFFLLVLRECKEISVVIGDENPLGTFDDSSEKNPRGHLFEFSGPWSARAQQSLTTIFACSRPDTSVCNARLMCSQKYSFSCTFFSFFDEKKLISLFFLYLGKLCTNENYFFVTCSVSTTMFAMCFL